MELKIQFIIESNSPFKNEFKNETYNEFKINVSASFILFTLNSIRINI